MKPIVKWVGGKTKLLEYITKEARTCEYKDYYEPFAGGCSVALRILSESKDKKVFVSDVNLPLINLYVTVKTNLESLVKELSNPVYSNDSDNYYINRTRFNEIKNEQNVECAALFVYLNKCCYNGMYRENSKGGFNIPFGKMKNPVICDIEGLTNFKNLFQNVHVSCRGYDNISPNSKDLVYMDPPYHQTFTNYNKNAFGEDEQTRLKNFIDELTKKGVYVILSNSDTDFIRGLYKDYNLIELSTAYSIGGKNASRGNRKELLIKNF